MANGDKPLSADIGPAILTGQAAGQTLAQKAFDLEKQRSDMEQQQQVIKVAKMQSFFNDVDKVITTPQGKIRNLLKERAKMKAAETGLVVDPLFYEQLDNEDMYVPLAKTMADFAGLPTTDEQAQAFDRVSGLLPDINATTQALLKIRVGIQEQAMQTARQAQTQATEQPKQLDELVKEWSGPSSITAKTRAVTSGYNSLQAAAGVDEKSPQGKDLINRYKERGWDVKSASGAKDLMIIFSYMKMLDPTSVVRESEQEMVKNLGAVDERFRASIQKVLAGQQLDPRVRQEIVDAAKGKLIAQEQEQDNYNQFFLQRAESLGIPRQNALNFFNVSATGKAAAARTQQETIQLKQKQQQRQQLLEKAKQSGLTDEKIQSGIKAKMSNLGTQGQ